MNNGDKLNIKSDEKATVLDITGIRSTGEDLKTEIENAVRDTQTPILTTLPNLLLMRPDQFDDLAHGNELSTMYKSQERLYRTPLNIMEVKIKDSGSVA